MSANRDTLFWPRGFSRSVSRALPYPPLNWVPNAGGLVYAQSLEALAIYLQTYDAATFTPARLASMTANDMRYAQNLYSGILP